MLKFTFALIALLFMNSAAKAASVHLNPGEKYRVNRTTVYCDAQAQEQERRWHCTCYWGFANMGGVMVYAETVRKADELGLVKCQRERAPETNAVECYTNAN